MRKKHRRNHQFSKDKSLNLLRILNTRNFEIIPLNDDIECSFKPKINKKSKGSKSVLNFKLKKELNRRTRFNFGGRLHNQLTISSFERSKPYSCSRSKSRSKTRKEYSFGENFIPVSASFSHSPAISRNSTRFYNDLQKKIFKLIFNRIDQEKSGEISMQNLNLENINLETVGILNPLLSKIQSSTSKMSEQEFIQRCLKIYENLDPKARNILLKYKKHDCLSLKEYSFSPKITRKAKELVSTLYSGESIANRLHKLHNERKIKLFERKKAQEKIEF